MRFIQFFVCALSIKVLTILMLSPLLFDLWIIKMLLCPKLYADCGSVN